MSNLMSCCADCPYDVGDGFFTRNATTPEKRWPGTKWQQIKDMFILAAGDTYKLDATGGEAAHKLTVAEHAKHNHVGLQLSGYALQNISGNNVEYGACAVAAVTDFNKYGYGEGYQTAFSGNNQPHNNMPPYIVRYYWERTA